jgi:hypothetical protein
MRPRVAILCHPRSFFPFDLHDALGADVELVWVLLDATGDDPTMRRLLSRLGEVVDVCGLDYDEAARILGNYRLDGVVSFVDDHLIYAAELAVRLGLPYHTPEVAHVLTDKPLQREALARYGVAGPGFWSVPAQISPAELDALIARVKLPGVLKRAQGAGSRDMYSVADAAQLRAILASTGPHDWLLEEFLADDPDHDPRFASYLSVESVVSGARPSHVAVTGRFPLAEPFRETGNIIPGIMPEHMREPVFAMVDDAVAALSIESAVIHTEIKLTPQGPKLIEVNGRLGGRPPFVLRRVSAVNLFLAACLLAAGEPPRTNGLASCSGVGYWLMLQPPMSASRVSAVEGLGELAGVPAIDTVTLSRPPGDAVDWREGTDGVVITVRGGTSDHGALQETIDFIRRTVKITYDEGE